MANEVNGDVIAGGGKVLVDGNVSQDLMAGAGQLNVSGEVGDDVRAVAGNIQIDATIKGDLLAAGGDINLSDKTYVGGGAYMAAGNIQLNGAINGNVILAGGNIYLNSSVGGNVTLYRFKTVTFGPQAKVMGTLSYRASEALQIPAGMVQGRIDYKQLPKNEVKESMPAILARFSVFSFLSMLFFGLIMVWLFRFTMLHTYSMVNENALRSLGVGFLVLILTPVAAIILLLTTIGLPLFLVLMAVWLIALYVGKIMGAAVIGFKILKVDEKSAFLRVFGSFALGALIYVLIRMIPVLGWVIDLLLILTALGGLVFNCYELIDQLHKKKLA